MTTATTRDRPETPDGAVPLPKADRETVRRYCMLLDGLGVTFIDFPYSVGHRVVNLDNDNEIFINPDGDIVGVGVQIGSYSRPAHARPTEPDNR